MAVLRRVKAEFTTDGSGDATVYTDSVNGFLQAVFYDYDDAATGADFTITEEDTGRALLTITNAGVADLEWKPQIGTHPVANTAGGTASTVLLDHNAVVGRIKIVVAQGGDTKDGDLYFYLYR